MRRENSTNQESLAENLSHSPTVELFSNVENVHEIWPEEVANNASFVDQLRTRKELNERLNEVVSQLPRPDISLEDAVKQKLVTEEQVQKLYLAFSNLLESGQDYKRIVLYMPFEFLPDLKWAPENEELKQSADGFRASYMKAWEGLLTTHDVRANFVDGDVIDAQNKTEDYPRVVKAAHLIPKLVEKGFITQDYIFDLLKNSSDPVLIKSIADALLVLVDMGLLDKKFIKKIDSKPEEEKNSESVSLDSLQEKLEKEFEKIDLEKYPDLTERRINWLKQKKKQEVIETNGDNIETAIVKNAVTENDAVTFLNLQAKNEGLQALVNGIRKAIENNPAQAQDIYSQYREVLLMVWEKDASENKEELRKTFCRLNNLGIVDNLQLESLGIVMPKLAGPFSENLNLMSAETQKIREATFAIEADPELSKFLYPVALVYGSKLKGYGLPNSDSDVGVFVKPNISFEDRSKVQEILKKLFPGEEIKGEVLEFWLQEQENNLGVIDFGKPDTNLGDSYSTHILFSSAWEGNKDAILELRKKLLVPYMHDTKKIIHERDARGLYIEEIERDALQYRLMHKGYERLFSSYGGINTPHADGIDNKSMFWDSGYRQLATRLFASRVFLPKISE